MMRKDIIVDGAVEVMVRQQMAKCQKLFEDKESDVELFLSHVKSRRQYIKMHRMNMVSFNPLRKSKNENHSKCKIYQLSVEDSECDEKRQHDYCAPCSFQGFTRGEKIDSMARHYRMLETQFNVAQSLSSDEEEEISEPHCIKIHITEEMLNDLYQDTNEFTYSFETYSEMNPLSHNGISVENALQVETRDGNDNHLEEESDVSVDGDHHGMLSIATGNTITDENILIGGNQENEMHGDDAMSESRISSVVGSYNAFYDIDDDVPELADYDLASNELPAHITEALWQKAENIRPQSSMMSELGGEEDDDTYSNLSYLRRSASSRGYESDGWPTDISLADIDEEVDATLGQIYGCVPDVPPKKTYRYRLDLSRSGVHRPLRNYIHCGTHGAFSILLSSTYVVKDKGDAFVYLGEAYDPPREPQKKRRRWQRGSLSKVTKKKYKEKHDQRMIGGNLALYYSLQSHHPVRVVRAHSLKNEFAPQQGYRYDGLYHVLSVYQEQTYDGYTQYKFVFMHVDCKTVAITNYPSLWGDEERSDTPPLWENTQDSFIDESVYPSQFWKRTQEDVAVAPSVLPGHLRPINMRETMLLPPFQLTAVDNRVAVVVLHRLSASAIIRSMTIHVQEHTAAERNDCPDDANTTNEQPLILRRGLDRVSKTNWRQRILHWNDDVTAATTHIRPAEQSNAVIHDNTSETSEDQNVKTPRKYSFSCKSYNACDMKRTANKKDVLNKSLDAAEATRKSTYKSDSKTPSKLNKTFTSSSPQHVSSTTKGKNSSSKSIDEIIKQRKLISSLEPEFVKANTKDVLNKSLDAATATRKSTSHSGWKTSNKLNKTFTSSSHQGVTSATKRKNLLSESEDEMINQSSYQNVRQTRSVTKRDLLDIFMSSVDTDTSLSVPKRLKIKSSSRDHFEPEKERNESVTENKTTMVSCNVKKSSDNLFTEQESLSCMPEETCGTMPVVTENEAAITYSSEKASD